MRNTLVKLPLAYVLITVYEYIDGLVQDCSNSSTLAVRVHHQHAMRAFNKMHIL